MEVLKRKSLCRVISGLTPNCLGNLSVSLDSIAFDIKETVEDSNVVQLTDIGE